MARPVKFNPDDVAKAMNDYTDSCNDPLIKEFCLEYGISDERVRQLAENNTALFGAIKRLLAKQEIHLVRDGAANRINPTMAIFRLKQPVFGYTDKQEVKMSGNVVFAGEDALTD